MFDFNFLSRCMIIQKPEKGFIEMKQFVIYIVRQNVFIPRDLVLMIWALQQSESPWQRNDANTFFNYLRVSLY